MNRELIVEMIDNGLVFRHDGGYVEAVLYNEDEYNKFKDCNNYLGGMLIDEMMSECSDLSSESKRVYGLTGKPVVGFRLKISIEPVTMERIVQHEQE